MIGGSSWCKCVCVCGISILTLRLQGWRPEKIWSELTGAPQRVSVLCYAKHSFPFQREVSDRPWMGKGGRGRTRTLRAVHFLTDRRHGWAGGTGTDEPSMDSAMFPTEYRGLWISCMEGGWGVGGDGGGGNGWAFLQEHPHCHVSPNGTWQIWENGTKAKT